MAREHSWVRGRDDDLAAVRAALAASPGSGCLVVVRGPAGIGRSTLLEAAGRGVLPERMRVVSVRFGAEPDDRADTYGLGAMLRAVRDRFEQFGDRRLADSLNAVARLRALVGRNPEWWVPRMVTELGIMFDRIRQDRPTAILVDDAHLVAEPALLLTAARQSGCPVLVTCRDDVDQPPGLAELLTVADQVLTLGPLAGEHVDALIGRAAGAPLDEGVPVALRAALGPLFGHPGTVLATLRDLAASGRLTPVADRLCLRAPTAPIALPAGHHLLDRARQLGALGPRVLAAVAALDGLRVDDLPLLAGAIGARLTDCGRTLDELIAAGVLVIDEAGRVSCRCAALAAFAVGQLGNAGRGRLHAALAGRLLADDSVDPALLADHIAAAGVAFTIDEPTLTWLLDFAAAIEADQPERAARWHAAALRRLTPDTARHARVLATLVQLSVQTGQYELLCEVLNRRDVRLIGPAALTDLKIAAVLVAMHTAAPLSEATVRALLDEPAVDGEPAGFAEWWFGHRLTQVEAAEVWSHPVHQRIGTRRLVGPEQTGLLLAALSADPDGCAAAWRRAGRSAGSPKLERLRTAGAWLDLATVFRIVFGAHYRLPEHGVLGAYRRVVAGYESGDWSAAMSAVRELELSGSRETVLHQAARLFAAEICAARGQRDRARDWLGSAKPAPMLAGLRAWAELGVLRGTEGEAEAARAALRTFHSLRANGLRGGLEQLLLRIAGLAVGAGEAELTAEVLAAAEDLHRVAPCALTLELVFGVRGLVHQDLVYLKVGLDLARGRGSRPDLMRFCLAVAQVADEPQPWLHEAYEIAGQCDSPLARERIRELIRERGVAAPRARGRRDTLSATERRIIELIQDGLTNRQIALDIRVSEKTVENHLTRLFARTGCRSRVELATASLEGRLLEVAS